MAGASLEELMSVLKNSGLPLGGNASDMQDAAPGAQQQIQSTVNSQDTTGPALQSGFHQQLSQIAAMDQKLHGLYNDPTSPLHINDPGKALRLQTGASDTGYKAANNFRSAEKANDTALKEKSSDAYSLYSKLTTVQNREESRAKSNLKDDIAVAGGKKQYMTDETGQKVAVSIPKGPKTKVDHQTKIDDLRAQKMQVAGLSDPDAVTAFDNTKPGYQEWYFKSQQDARNTYGHDTPPVTSQQVKENYAWWQKNVAPQPKKASVSFSSGNTKSTTNFTGK